MKWKRRKYVIHPNQRDWLPRKDFRTLPVFNKKHADRAMKIIGDMHIDLKDKIYQSDSLIHAHYIAFVFNYYQSFRRAYESDSELAIKTGHKAYISMLEYMDKSQRDMGLATFYSMCLEDKERTGSVLSHAAQYTILTSFMILYSSLMKFGNVKEKAYEGENKVLVSAQVQARRILLRTMADIEAQGLIKIDPNVD